ncbi:cytochrome P450 [Fomitopsis serialis]|uniref:cytochrome P450 n=1 Tax=Fomitopsis serialis TaxID=139415 RepID=UPI002007E330|nr:cytochrome P450 [Neoantrodia serialis]KAH9925312.1 cytochrome P450 [Neoantrodia serialis]
MYNLVILCLVSLLAYVYSVRNRRQLSVPPGPRGIPLLGNALQLPKQCYWLTFAEWAKTYGPVMHISIVSSPIIVLSSREAISDLLEKRSLMYSDRPVVPMAGELAGMEQFTALAPYGQRHREGRKLILSAVSTRKTPGLHIIEESKTADFISRLARSPSELRSHIRWVVASIVLQITYGINALDCDDPFIRRMERGLKDFDKISAPGAYLVDVFPFLKHIPEWFPGASFKRVAREFRSQGLQLENKLYQTARDQLDHGTATHSFVADLLAKNHSPTPEEHELYRQVSTQFLAAGWDTTVSSLLSFFLIMAQHPEIQRKAQAEVDASVSGRLPKISDRKEMPYLEAVLKEVHRWNPAVPLALPHNVRREDVYAGFRIPAGSTVFANTWAVLHDPALYPRPDEVIPERYLDKSGEQSDLNPDPRDFAFGYGRRVCPGRMLAEDTLFIVAASVLASFNIGDAIPREGETVKYGGGIVVSHPDDFTCTIIPRRFV